MRKNNVTLITANHLIFKSTLCFHSEEESIVSEEDCSTVSIEVEYPPGTKLKVRYGRARNIKIYDAKVMEVTVDEDKQIIYSVHYAGWNVRYG